MRVWKGAYEVDVQPDASRAFLIDDHLQKEMLGRSRQEHCPACQHPLPVRVAANRSFGRPPEYGQDRFHDTTRPNRRGVRHGASWIFRRWSAVRMVPYISTEPETSSSGTDVETGRAAPTRFGRRLELARTPLCCSPTQAGPNKREQRSTRRPEPSMTCPRWDLRRAESRLRGLGVR
jgi:hypothetical protein